MSPNVGSRARVITARWKSFSLSQTGSERANDRKPLGAKARYVSKIRSNLRKGLS